jgi:sulfoxide reductase heme-binding subunit YedZ
MGYRPIATGIGIIAGYLAALLGLSFYARRRIGARLWRRAHRLTVVVWLMAAIHAFTAGTDASTPWMHAILVASAAPIAALFAARTLSGRRKRRPARAALAAEAAS